MLLCASPALATTYAVAHDSEVDFGAKITGGSFQATSKGVSGKVEYDEAAGLVKAATIIVKADSFTTGMTTRDEHMRDKYLEAQKFPEIRLELKDAKLPLGSESEVEAALTIKGTRKNIKIKVAVAKDSGRAGATAKFPINVTEFGIPQPKFAVVKMDPVVAVSVRLNFFKVGN